MGDHWNRTLVTDRCIWPNSRFLHFRTFILRQNRRSNLQAADLVGLRQCKAELLRIMIDVLNRLKLQRDEALVTTCESGLASGFRCLVVRSSYCSFYFCLCLCGYILDLIRVLLVKIVSAAS